MNRVAEFEKISYLQFKKDWINAFSSKYYDWDEEVLEDHIRSIYDSIKLPERATSGSAGYDFFSPLNIKLKQNETIKVPTGIKCYMEEGWVLQLYPRSSFGFKYGLRLSNTVGIVDEDYYNNDNNEGHIFVKLINDSTMYQSIPIKSGEAFCQGILLPFGITYGDDVCEVRSGGIGSTSK